MALWLAVKFLGSLSTHCIISLALAGLREMGQKSSLPTNPANNVEKCRAALRHCPPGNSRRSSSLNNLAISLQSRFKQRGIMSDLDEAIELHRAALLLRPPGHSDRSMSLNNLASSLRSRFEQRGIMSDLDEAIELHRAALLLYPPGHSLRSMSLNNLANSLQSRFEQRGVQSDLDEAIELHRAALLLRPPGHSLRSSSLNNLALSLRSRFEQRGIMSDLDEAIELHRAALLLYPPGHSDRSMSLNNLALSLRSRFEQRGIMSDLDEAIELHRAALLLYPPGHSDRSMSLNNLANSLQSRFEQRGIMSDLDEAIELHRAALLLYPPGHSLRSMSLNNLASSLQSRFEQRGIMSDLDEAIELHRAALLLYPPGHSLRSMSLNNLANSLQSRFEQRGIMSDLDEAIELHRAALLLYPPGHSDRSMSLNNLALSLRSRFEQRGIMSDLDEAIELHRAALLLYPPGHSDRSMSLNNLANSLRSRFEQRGIMSDLDEAIELHRAALLLRPPGHSDRSMSLNNLANSLRSRFEQRGVQSDLDEAFSLYLQLSCLSNAASRTDLSVAKSWAASADTLNHDSALLAYKTALKFLDQHVALFVRHGALMTAVELVEQGRAVFWTQLARFSTPLDELSVSSNTGTALAEEFKRLSFRLHNVFDQSTGDQSPQIRQLTMQWDDVVSRIRMLHGFSRFLLPPLFSDLQKAAEDGPVIVLNASQYGCDALIIHSTEDPVHVSLDTTQAEVSELSSEFQSLAGVFGSSDRQYTLVRILRKLWDHVVQPIIQSLEKSKIPPRSRIWWCPTAEFTLLPIHAAGPYEEKKDNLSDIYISSYTPTLATLIRARKQVSRDPSSQHFVAIGQANPDRGKGLRCVAPELAIVAKRVEPVVSSFTSLEDSDATVQGALDALNHNQWLHLACHGMPNRQQPFESSFAMRDGPLMIKDIIRSNWQNSEFAFLSACHTTVGDEKSPDESIHLAAAMQFCGFRSVIGSMWSVDDEVARQVASVFYRKLIRVDDSRRLDCTHAAAALHKAVKSLRNKIPLEQQIVFVHMGV
ncbi:TPR-like protein [Suillus subalutaceus]|uniref:TPR-like protein n=1 Tax=Suillus subalutaceus TaxID=48586 RepID=UPI001B86EE92|nr:TPR-like protein [Suillus subalutaceus]KAG1830277.1 TPR-like protein [Suillus subalutaceus]